MKSIRLALVFYFLVLLLLALGAVSAVVYQTTSQGLHAKEVRTRELLHDRFEARCRAERDKVDASLLRQARGLASFDRRRAWDRNRSLTSLGVLAAAASPWSPSGQMLAPLWLAESNNPWIIGRLSRIERMSLEPDAVYVLGGLSAAMDPLAVLTSPLWIADPVAGRVAARLLRPIGYKPNIPEMLLPGNGEDQDIYFCQVTSQTGQDLQRSRSLGNVTWTIPPQARKKVKPGDGLFDDQVLPSGARVRRVTLKAPPPRFITFHYRFFVRNVPGVANRPAGQRAPVYFIQCARDTSARDKALAGFRAEYDRDVAGLAADTRDTLDALRRQLLWISLATFVATVAGGFLLVRLGLSPLRHLSEAVSRVSEKDFRLQVDGSRLPQELQPIVQRLHQTLGLLQRAFAREKQAAADISHDLRTPLAALLTTTEVALRKPRSPEEYRELLADCRESGKQMSQMVERLLALARLDAGADTLRPSAVDVTVVADQCAALVRPLADAQGLQLRVKHNGPVQLETDPDKLREVLTNLLANAIQYNRPEGSIDLVVERDNGDLRLEVRDTGIGIAASDREHIFERFYRADRSRPVEGLHAGLGLAIVKGYVELMGGTIGVDSEEGQGSTFRIQLPLRAPGAARKGNARAGRLGFPENSSTAKT
jgi:heavy metal sensor kinase